jgi:CHAT domain-containing protein
LLYSDLGNYNKALELNLECLVFYEKIFGRESADYELSLGNLALSYSNLGDYSKALELNLECLALSEKIYGKEHPKYAVSLGNLAESYSRLGDYSKALELHLNCFALSEKIYGKEHPNYAIDLNNLASTYSYLGEYSKSLELYLESLKVREINIGKEHPDYVLVLNNIASTYSDLGEYNKALELELECLSLREKILGKEHPDYAVSLGNLAGSYSDLGDYSKSLELNLECLEIREKILGKEHPNYALSLNNTGFTYRYLKNYNEAYSFLSQSQEATLLHFVFNEKNLNTNLVSESYNFLFDDYQTLFSISNHLGSSIKIKDQYNVLCFLKGRELTKNTSMVADIYQSDDEGLMILYKNWLLINRKIAVCFENPLEERMRLGLDIEKLQDEADDLERQLVKGSAVFALNQRNYSFNDIISNLKSDEAYLDIVNIQTYNLDRYYAYIIKKGDSIPELVDLGSIASLDSIYRYYSNYTQKRPSNKVFSYEDEYYGNICYKNFWSKLEPYLEGVSNVYFSPEGVYSKINPNVLYDSTARSFLMDKYDIVYISNVEDFVHQKEKIQLYERPDDLHAILVGNPTFLLGEDEIVFARNTNQSRVINQDELDSLKRGASLSQLPATQTEVDLISRNLKSKGWDVELISGVDATETRVKSIEAPKILHIATHGFFFENQEMIKRTNMISKDNKKAVGNPMTRSGLIFSGAENTMNGEILADDNGWLNSYEASLLNLRGTELVVLSACETGTGDVQNGKGVYGLQRAIRVAGAESLIMSMWEVDDKATQELMTNFYDYWIDKKMTKKDAFKKAQEKIREKYKHPYYWGAFIMLGE